MSYWLIHIPIISLLSYLFWKRFRSDFHPIVYWSGLCIKLAAGLMLGYIFGNYYSDGDTFLFFERATEIASLPFNEYVALLLNTSDYASTNQPRVLYFTKFLSFFSLISGGSYWISSLYLSQISFFASWYLIVKCYQVYPRYCSLATAIFLYLPTVVFWSSGILKDTLAFAAFAFLITIILLFYNRTKVPPITILLSIIAVFILWRIRHYLLIGIILFTGILFFLKLVRSSSMRIKWISVVTLLASFVMIQYVHPFLNLKRLPLTLFENNHAIIEKTETEDQLHLDIESPDWQSIIPVIPKAAKTGLFRPSLLDHTPYWGIFHQIENGLIILCLTLSTLIYLKTKPQIDWNLAISGFLVVLLLATMLALSTPNFGTLVRYKNAFIPFLALLSSVVPYRYFTKNWEE